ncbi:DUF2326 domain-containing protein [Litoribacter populi]|uniref:DUF2326 domain-containing protein n=1 Tax=Litoribacter populi TaxID=2598460 RepID=UPI00117BFCB0|nr:DUF2326 domain-containing protein [Litoribacter populi]
MFIKSLVIHKAGSILREINFHKGINLIVDETQTQTSKESGNNVGKTTVLRLIDFCLGGKGENIFKDPEFKGNNQVIKEFLTSVANGIVVELILKPDLNSDNSEEIVIRRNFLKSTEKLLEINKEQFKDINLFSKRLKYLIFKDSSDRPTFRQIIAKNIRDEKNKLQNTIRVLHPITRRAEYEALYFFWLGISSDEFLRKQKLLTQIKLEESLQARLKGETDPHQIEQALIVLENEIKKFERKKSSFSVNPRFEDDLKELNIVKRSINKISGEIGQLEMRRDLILESKSSLEKETSNIDTEQVRALYEEAKLLLPSLQKSFEETLLFHNQMVKEKIKFIGQELPEVEVRLNFLLEELDIVLKREMELSRTLQKGRALDELQGVIDSLNDTYEKKGRLEEQKRLWDKTESVLTNHNEALQRINELIKSKEEIIKTRLKVFNKYFSDISNRLYGEFFILSHSKSDGIYELNISSIGGNLGTGKKKGQIAAFDLAYIQFADELGIKCLHFILHDQLENVHHNQITSLLNEIVTGINCQYILPILRDKLPPGIKVSDFEVLSLSQSNKLLKVD